MCGIAGVIDPVAERAAARVHLLNDAQTHRGPDHAAVTRASVITLGNTRLAIRDLTPAGNQPFVSADGRYVCVFNGEIYNHRQLAERFLLPVRTACDGEVIPHLWSKLGMESLAELRGMFAIALADVLKERLYLARDPFGIKPLYWRLLSDGSLAFASEVPAAGAARSGHPGRRRGGRPFPALRGDGRRPEPVHGDHRRPAQQRRNHWPGPAGRGSAGTVRRPCGGRPTVLRSGRDPGRVG